MCGLLLKVKTSLGSTNLTTNASEEKIMIKKDYFFRKHEIREYSAKVFQIYFKSYRHGVMPIRPFPLTELAIALLIIIIIKM